MINGNTIQYELSCCKEMKINLNISDTMYIYKNVYIN